MHQIRRLLFVLLLVCPAIGLSQTEAVTEAVEDKFAIAADSDQTSSAIAKLAGIAPFFHIYDINGNLLEVLANPHLDLEWGTGPAAATTLADMGVTVLVARNIPGPKMEDVLVARKIRIVRRVGTVGDVVKELKEE
jgi:predicted Fe-Mo cluster-binding NifX family protein